MQQFQSLQRLLIFYALTLAIMLFIYYFALFHEMQESNEQQSVDTFYILQHEITEHAEPLNSEITKILEKPAFEGISYQLVFMQPSGQAHIHSHTRPNEVGFSTIVFPKVITSLPADGSNSAYTLTTHNLAGAIEFKSGHKLHIILRHKAFDINWISYRYWLPLMAAIMLFITALLYMLKRRNNWEQLLLYTDNLSSHAKDAYIPPPFIEHQATAEFLRLGHTLSRISYQLHNNHRRIKTLEHRLERLVDQAPLAMLMIMRHGKISFFNQRFEQLFISLSQHNDHYELSDFFVGQDESTQTLLKNLSNLRVTRTVTVYGLQNQQPYQLHITPWFGEHGQLHGFTVLLNSIHEFIEQNTQLQQQNEQIQLRLDELNKLKSVMGHKLRLPLESMIDTLEPIDPKTLSITQNQTLNVLIETSQNMLTALNDTLDIGEIEVRKTRLSIKPIDIYKLGQEVNDLIIDKVRQQGLELIYIFNPTCPRCIDTDDVRLRQILLNLLHNAINVTTSGYVALTIEAVNQEQVSQISEERLSANNGLPTLNEYVASEQSHHWVRFSVQDTGVGIAPIKQKQLLNYFAYSHSPNHGQDVKQIEQNVIGTGVGLNDVNSFARLLGGFIELKSTVDKGSTFDLYLPCRYPNYQSVYHRSPHLTHIHLIAVVSQPLVADYLYALCSYLSITATIHTAVDLATIQQLTTQLAQDVQTLAPILLLDYEYHDIRTTVVDVASQSDELKQAHERSVNHEQKIINSDSQQLINGLITDTSLPKILFSMKPERRIPSILLDKCDGFLAKPLDSALLLSELMRLTLPVRQVLAQAQTREADVSKPNNELNSVETVSPLILVVEDSPTNQKIACKILAKLGYRTIVAEDGQQALDVLQAQRQDINLILMDCRMPVMDGLQATQAIRAQGDNIPIVALTANNSEEDRTACLAVGMDEFLSKPINKTKLQEVLETFIKI